MSDPGSQVAFSMANSKVTCISSAYLSKNAGVYDENSNVTLIDNGTISVAGIFNTVPFTTAIGKDIVTAGLWDRSGGTDSGQSSVFNDWHVLLSFRIM